MEEVYPLFKDYQILRFSVNIIMDKMGGGYGLPTAAQSLVEGDEISCDITLALH